MAGWSAIPGSLGDSAIARHIGRPAGVGIRPPDTPPASLDRPMIFALLLSISGWFAHLPPGPQDPGKLADRYSEAIDELNADHARKPGKTTESELALRVPQRAVDALNRLLEETPADDWIPALERCASAALDLVRVEDFDRIRERLSQVSEERARRLGVALARERILLIGEGGLDRKYLEHFAEVVEDVLEAYDEVFGFEEYSKVPGKKLRLRVHLEPEIGTPPHFAPQYEYHSEIDFPVIDAERLRSPTAQGQFLFYGLCHELGHVIAMWGDRTKEEDHHAWAHFTGLVIVEHFAQLQEAPAWLKDCKDSRWQSLEAERKELEGVEAGLQDRSGVLSLLVQLHDIVGPAGLGVAINTLDMDDKRLRIRGVRYYTFRELEQVLQQQVRDKAKRKLLKELFE